MTKHQGLFEVTLSFYSTAETSSTSDLDIHQHVRLYCLPAPFLAAKIFNYISQIFNHISQSIQLYFLLFLATKVGVEISCKCTIQAQMTRAVMGKLVGAITSRRDSPLAVVTQILPKYCPNIDKYCPNIAQILPKQCSNIVQLVSSAKNEE